MKLHFVLCLLLIGAGVFPLKAEPIPKIKWQISFGTEAEDVLKVARETIDGGYVLGGSSPTEDSDFRVIRLDHDGNTLWNRTYGGTGRDVFLSLQQTFDGGYILGGESRSDVSGDKASQNIGEMDFWVVKLDAQGNKQWDQTYGSTNWDTLSCLQQTTDGGYILGGWLQPMLNDLSDWQVFKISSNGTIQWHKVFGGSAGERLDSLKQTSDGGYLLVGFSASDASGNKTSLGHGLYDGWVIKLDAAGNKEWEQSYGGDTSDELSSVQELSGGNGYLLAGKRYAPPFDRRGATDHWLLKVDTSGVMEWQKFYSIVPPPCSFIGYPIGGVRLAASKFGGYLLGSVQLKCTGESSSATADYYLLKVSETGEKQWEQTFGGVDKDYLQDLQATSDGYIVAGYSASGVSGHKTSENIGDFDFWVLKLETFPVLTSIVDGNTLRLTWATNQTGFELQSTAGLALDNWATLTNEATVVDGRFCISDALTNTNRFYRLRNSGL